MATASREEVLARFRTVAQEDRAQEESDFVVIEFENRSTNQQKRQFQVQEQGKHHLTEIAQDPPQWLQLVREEPHVREGDPLGDFKQANANYSFGDIVARLLQCRFFSKTDTLVARDFRVLNVHVSL